MIIKPNKCYDLAHKLNKLTKFDMNNPKNYHSNIYFLKKQNMKSTLFYFLKKNQTKL
jgi:hypothetical protein